MLELSFSINSEKYKSGKFFVDGLHFVDEEGIQYDNLKFELDGKPYDEEFATWSGRTAPDWEVFNRVISDYINKNTEYFSDFEGDWDIFDKYNSMKEFEGDLMITMPIIDDDMVELWHLDLATPNHLYYSKDEYCRMCDHNLHVLTDIAEFYEEEINSDIAQILLGNLKCLYMSDNVKYWIESYGKDKFIEEYGGGE